MDLARIEMVDYSVLPIGRKEYKKTPAARTATLVLRVVLYVSASTLVHILGATLMACSIVPNISLGQTGQIVLTIQTQRSGMSRTRSERMD